MATFYFSKRRKINYAPNNVIERKKKRRTALQISAKVVHFLLMQMIVYRQDTKAGGWIQTSMDLNLTSSIS